MKVLLDTGEVSYRFVDNLAKLVTYAREFWREQLRGNKAALEGIEDHFLKTLDLLSGIPVINRIEFKPDHKKIVSQ